MDFERVLKDLLERFDQSKVRYAVIGGFALGALGAPRATVDLDFLVHHDDLKTLNDILTALGYNRIFHSDNVSQYEGKDQLWGCLDFIHASRKISLAMLERSIVKPVFQGARRMRVLRPEDIVGLKVQAMVNDPKRRAKETADIEALVAANLIGLDWSRISEFYELFDRKAEFQALKRSMDA